MATKDLPSRAFRNARQLLIRQDIQIRRAVRNAVFDAADELVSNVETTVSDWDHKPRFRKQVSVSPAYISVEVTPTGRNKQIFEWVDQGTEGPYRIPKFIRPETQSAKPVLLKFRTGYNARTAPTAKHHQGSGQASGPWRAAHQVTHPGIEARLFLETLSQELKPSLDRRIENAIRRVLR